MNKPGISREEFIRYCHTKDGRRRGTVTALRILTQLKWDKAMPLPIGMRPPQNWQYFKIND
jgi:hypothetical protein